MDEYIIACNGYNLNCSNQGGNSLFNVEGDHAAIKVGDSSNAVKIET